MTRIHNFSAGPAVLPEDVLLEAKEALWNFQDSGMGIMEISHRSMLYEEVIRTARDRLRRLLCLDDDQEILFMHGGASSQFFMIPMNFLQGGRAAYLETGHWSTKAIAEARRFGTPEVLWTSASTQFDRVPHQGDFGLVDSSMAYLHYTSNNTIYGTQLLEVPDTNGVPLFCDASSDILSRPIRGSAFDLLYAGAQKNLGPSGVTVVAIRKSLLEKAKKDIPTMLRYSVHLENESMYNTPNTWGIYLIERVCAWIERLGLENLGNANQHRAQKIYTELERTGFWKLFAQKNSRSIMNVTFTTGDTGKDTLFHKSAEKNGLSGLKGHRILGGLRASLYNAQTDAAVNSLVLFMQEFERVNG